MIRSLLVILMSLAPAGCFLFRETKVPMPARVLADPPDARALVVLLPGIKDRPRSFARHDFARPLAHTRARIVAADSHYGYFEEHSVVERLRQDVVDRHAPPGAPVVMVGVSLGGLGSLLYWCDTHDRRIDTLVLLSPYLGDAEIIEQIRATGVDQWQPAADTPDLERRVWTCLANWDGPRLLLGYGDHEEMAPAHRLLASRLPDDQVHVLAGGDHSWQTWAQLWPQMAPELALPAARGH